MCVFVCLRILRVCVCTCDDGRHTPPDGIVEPHGSVVDVASLCLHAVDVEPLHKQPGKRGHEEIVQQDGHHRTQELTERSGRENSQSHV